MGLKIFRPFVEIFFYGNIFISLTSICMVWLTTYSLNPTNYHLHPYDYFVFFGTLTLYNLHRYIGQQKIKSTALLQDRFIFMKLHRPWMLASIVLSGTVAAYLGFPILIELKFILIIPILISGFYAIPIFNKRLRDISYVKIFLIAFSWSWLTAYIPAALIDQSGIEITLICLERFLFILAITIPFDIRDIRQDQEIALRTIVNTLGIYRSKILAVLFLLLAAVIAYYLLSIGIYNSPLLISILIAYIISAWLVINSNPNRQELYFVGWLDGMMALPFIIVMTHRLFI